MQNLGLNVPAGIAIADAMADCAEIARRVLAPVRNLAHGPFEEDVIQRCCWFVADMAIGNPEVISFDGEWVEWVRDCDRDQFAGWLETHLG